MKKVIIIVVLMAFLAGLSLMGPTMSTAQEEQVIKVQAKRAAIAVDGDLTDWSGIPEVALSLKPYRPSDRSVGTDVRVAFDAQNLYLLFQVHDDYDYDPTDPHKSASPVIQWAIDEDAGPHMGAGGKNWTQSLGMVDIWHWKLESGPTPLTGIVAGGKSKSKERPGDDELNCDDEYAKTPVVSDYDRGENGENSLRCAWSHSGQAGGTGTTGVYTFEFSRPLVTGDPHDAKFTIGGTAKLALAYFDADEHEGGWTVSGHLQSADLGWLIVAIGE